MDRNFQLAFRAMGALLFCFFVASSSFAQNLPDDTGKAEFLHNCLDCHSAGMVLQAKKTPDEWRKNVDDMAARGSDGSKEDLDKVVAYLSKHFATDKPAPVATPAPTALSRGSAREMRPVKENSCLTSQSEKHGPYSGPAWKDLKSLVAATAISGEMWSGGFRK